MKNNKPRWSAMLGLAGGLLLGATTAWSGWDPATLSSRMKMTAPAAGARLAVAPSADGALLAALADYQGGPLPAEDSIVLELDPPAAARFQVSYFQGGPMFAPYQTAPVWVRSLAQAPAQTQFALWQEPGGEWGCLIALVGGGLRTWLKGNGQTLVAAADSLDSHFAPTRVPMFAIGWGQDPYQLIDDLYEFGFEVMKNTDPASVAGRRRVEKEFPEIWKYLGWCSWNAYYRTVTQQDLYRNAASFQRAGVPVRWILIDDGWSQVNKQTMNPWWQGRLYLTGLEADPHKFPGGLQQTVSTLKQEYGLTWVGVWHTFNGYWNGILMDSDAGRACSDCLLPVSEKVAVPDPRSNAGAQFWEVWYQFLKDAGVDFVKVDNQGTFPTMTREVLPVAHSSAQAHRNWEAAADQYFGSNVMDCMEQNIDTIYQWNTTNLGRAAVDYTPYLYFNPRVNVLNNVMNSLWFTQVLEPDYDMWMSHDWHAVYNAAAHAVSGGPIYTTDKPGKEKFEFYWPLIYADGLVIRPSRPALPLKKYLLLDPRTDRVPLAAFAPAGEAGLLAAWNVDRLYRPLTAEFRPADLEGLAGERFAVYEYFSSQLTVLGRRDLWPVHLKSWDVKLYSVVPIESGFAPIGLADKYIAAATVGKIERSPDRVVVTLYDAGTFAAYCETKPATIKLDGATLAEPQVEWNGQLLKIQIAGRPGERSRPQLEFVW